MPDAKPTEMLTTGVVLAPRPIEDEMCSGLRKRLAVLDREFAIVRRRIAYLMVEYERVERSMHKSKGGRPRNMSDLKPHEVVALVRAMGGMRAASRKLSCSVTSVHNYCRGKRSMPADLAEKLRQLTRGLDAEAQASLSHSAGPDRLSSAEAIEAPQCPGDANDLP